MPTTTSSLPTYFISHGGGPWPWMKDLTGGAYDRLAASLQQIPRDLGRTPKAVLVISGHWEESEFTVMTTARPPMIYDYYGFPEHTYKIQYPAPGSPQTAERVRQLIAAAGIPVGADNARGFDHGTFSPLAVIYPDANIPVFQLSMKSGYDPAAHLAVGRALAPLRDEGVLIVGSGLSYHNLRAFGPQARQPSAAFDQWLDETLVGSTPEQREARLLAWAKAPSARAAHPQEDHLLPLMVAVGAAERESSTRCYHEDAFMGGISVSSFRFGKT
jgi:aromatic ring-opening dioxygenase catalytic subunit (LigB family)